MNLILRDKRILVSGASGLIGTSVIKLLLEEGAKIRALVRNPLKTKYLQHSNIEIKVIDFADPATFKNTVQDCQIVFHFAGVLNEFKPYSYYQQVNVVGTRVLAELAIENGVERFIHTSTVWVYGLQTVGQIDETSPRIKSGNFYADSKLEGEEIVHRLIRDKNLPAVIVLPSQAYGPEDPSWTQRPLELIRSGRMILVNGGQGLMQPIFIDDLAEGILLAAKTGEVGQSYILCGQQSMSIREYFSLLANLVGKQRLPTIPLRLAKILARSAEYWAGLTDGNPIFTRQEIQATVAQARYNGDKARKELGFIPKTDSATGMAKIKQWIESGNM
jgi:nucleoside-diphosphate-sugar epimerase